MGGLTTGMPGPEIPKIAPPVPIAPDHDLGSFDCGHGPLNDWLRRRALANQLSGASRTYVANVGAEPVGFYSLAAGGVLHRDAPGKVRRNMPDPIPVVILGRLAVALSWQGRGVGSALLRDAVLRAHRAAGLIGIRALLVHAKDDAAMAFYGRHGFSPSPVDARTMMVTMSEVGANLETVASAG